eukprot:CAMPEP_0197387208 /NCGR_PEP_ID=MMETSP1165-20131217/390_1 /TAXON_ID=284809 /ORGANISM="Chrysocystis fragilis, Strain CCMP3189" /LENGTH=119 /DNA_ID=CAMNT_0042912517 /DNA_START=207 /DNA_END=566 /DNA_ORIENTATION=+
MSDVSSILSTSGGSLSQQSTESSQRSGQKHCMSEENLAAPKDPRLRVTKRTKTNDIEEVAWEQQPYQGRRHTAPDPPPLADDPHLDESCPGFFPGCGSLVPCDECTDKNRLSILMDYGK